MQHKEGHYVDIMSRVFLVTSDDGIPVGLVGTHVDCTERNKLEKKFHLSQ